MNVYAVHTTVEVTIDRGWHDLDGVLVDPPVYDKAYSVIAAKSPGQARAILCRRWDLEYTTPISIQLLTHDADLPIGELELAGDDDVQDWAIMALHVHAGVLFGSLSEAGEYEQWQGWRAVYPKWTDQ